MRQLLAVIPALALIGGTQESGTGKTEQDKKGGSYSESRGRTEHGREEWKHKGQGHFPHDANGDVIVSRSEWPGNDDTFRRLDRNGDGVLSEADRKLRADKRYHERR
jgi:hypothetical protein